MNDYLTSLLLNPTETIKNKIPFIIEAFVSYYGEEIRDEVTEKFNKVCIIGYQSTEEKKNILKKIRKNKENELLSNLFSKYNLEFTEDNKEKLMGSGSFKDIHNTRIEQWEQLVDLYYLGEEERHQQFIKEQFEYYDAELKELGLTLEDMLDYSKNGIPDDVFNRLPDCMNYCADYIFDMDHHYSEKKFREKVYAYYHESSFIRLLLPNLTEEDFCHGKGLDIIKLLYHDFLHCADEYDMYMSQFASYQDEIDFVEKLRVDLEKKYTIQLVDELIDIFPKHIQEKYQREKQNDQFKLSVLPEIQTIIGGLDHKSILEAFSIENEKLLNSNSRWEEHRSLIMDRCNYFQQFGIDLNLYNYSSDINSVECQKIWPKQSLINRVLETKRKCLRAFNEQYYSSLPDYQIHKKRIDSLNLLDDAPLVDIYPKLGTGFAAYIRVENGTYKGQNLIFINCCSDDEYLDKGIIHEFNHLFELGKLIIFLNSNKIEFQGLCGWDTLSHCIYTSDSDDLKPNAEQSLKKYKLKKYKLKKYELFNEIINETLSQEISSCMHRQGIYLFNSKDRCCDFGGTEYQKGFCIVDEFKKNYKESIIESRRNDNIEVIFDTCGKENFDNLNNLVNDFNKNFPGKTYYNLMDDLKNEQNTALTAKYYAIMNQKNQIMVRMNEYHTKHI